MSDIRFNMSPLADRLQCWRLVQDTAGFRFSQLLRRDQAPDDNCNYLRSLDWGIVFHVHSSVRDGAWSRPPALTALQVLQSGMTKQHMRLGCIVILRHVTCREESRAMRMLHICCRLAPLVC